MRYPMVEFLGGLFALGTYLRFGLGIETLIYYLFIAALLVVTFIDIDHRIIPDVITLPGIPICFAASFALTAITYKDALLGILIGGGSLFLVAWVYGRPGSHAAIPQRHEIGRAFWSLSVHRRHYLHIFRNPFDKLVF